MLLSEVQPPNLPLDHNLIGSNRSSRNANLCMGDAKVRVIQLEIILSEPKILRLVLDGDLWNVGKLDSQRNYMATIYIPPLLPS